MGQILNISIIPSSVHVPRDETVFTMATGLRPTKETVKILVLKKPSLLLYLDTLNQTLLFFPFVHIFLLMKLGSRNAVLWPVLGRSEFRKARAIKVNDADPFKSRWNALKVYQIFLK